MKHFFIILILSLGCSSVGKNNNDTGTKDIGKTDTGNTDSGTQDVVEQDQGGDSNNLDLPDCFYESDTVPIEHFILTGKNTEQDVSFVLALCQYAHDVGETMLHRADYFSVTWKGVQYDVAKEDIMYTNTKHSWFDSLEVKTEQVDFKWSAIFHNQTDPVQFIHTLSGRVGTEVLEETTMMDVSCDNCSFSTFVIKN